MKVQSDLQANCSPKYNTHILNLSALVQPRGPQSQIIMPLHKAFCKPGKPTGPSPEMWQSQQGNTAPWKTTACLQHWHESEHSRQLCPILFLPTKRDQSTETQHSTRTCLLPAVHKQVPSTPYKVFPQFSCFLLKSVRLLQEWVAQKDYSLCRPYLNL